MKSRKNSTQRSRNGKRAKVRPANSESTPRNDAGRIGMLKRKLDAVQEGILAAIRGGDTVTKSRLDIEATELRATIYRAESLVGR